MERVRLGPVEFRALLAGEVVEVGGVVELELTSEGWDRHSAALRLVLAQLIELLEVDGERRRD